MLSSPCGLARQYLREPERPGEHEREKEKIREKKRTRKATGLLEVKRGKHWDGRNI
jgi:hypothetical protein